MAHQIPCLASRWADEWSDAQDRHEAAFDAASAELSRESVADLAARVADFLTAHPTRQFEGWEDLEGQALLDAVADDDLLWDDIVAEAL